MRTLAILALGVGLLLPLEASAASDRGCNYAGKNYSIGSLRCQRHAAYQCVGRKHKAENAWASMSKSASRKACR